MGDISWRHQLRAEGVDRRPAANDAKNRPDRGYVEQPEERVEPRKAPVILPDNHLRRRLEVRPTPSAPTVCVRPEPDGDFEPPGGDDELEELEAVGRQLDSQRPSALAPPPPQRETPPPPASKPAEQALVRVVREPSETPPPVAPGRVRDVALARVQAGQSPEVVAPALHLEPNTLKGWVNGRTPGLRQFFRKEDQSAAADRVLVGGETQAKVARSIGATQSCVSRWVMLRKLERQGKPEREESAMGKTQKDGRKSPTFTPPKVKLAAVRRLRQLEQEEGKGRGQLSRVAAELDVSPHNLSQWSQSGEWEPEQGTLAPVESKTLLSAPAAAAAPPAPPSLPAPPVSAVRPSSEQPPAFAPSGGDLTLQLLQALVKQQAPQPAPQSAPAMLGLEEYIRGVVRMELEAAIAKHLPAALQRMLTGATK